MGDYYQNGIITTLHNLTNRSVEYLEMELVKFSKRTPMSLVLPSLYSELDGRALPNILDHLKHVPYLEEIIIGLDQANEQEFERAKEYFARLPQHHRILWHDGPRLKALDKTLQDEKLAPSEMGKGRNVWYCYGYILSSGRARAIALHDCDILTYDRDMLARLLYPIVNPSFTYHFCKGYYYRMAKGKLNGRVSRLFVTPLIRALKKVVGPIDYLEFMDSFRYPLAGEFAMRTHVMKGLRIPSDWGLEVGVLSEIQRKHSPRNVCQVDVASAYDHKHQDLSQEDQGKGLSKMSVDIAKTLFRRIAMEGFVFNYETFRTINTIYYATALDFVEKYYNEALINGLQLDRHTEEQAVEMFANNIMGAGNEYLDNPKEVPFIPNWNRVMSAIPNFLDQIYEAVHLDNQ